MHQIRDAHDANKVPLRTVASGAESRSVVPVRSGHRLLHRRDYGPVIEEQQAASVRHGHLAEQIPAGRKRPSAARPPAGSKAREALFTWISCAPSLLASSSAITSVNKLAVSGVQRHLLDGLAGTNTYNTKLISSRVQYSYID